MGPFGVPQDPRSRDCEMLPVAAPKQSLESVRPHVTFNVVRGDGVPHPMHRIARTGKPRSCNRRHWPFIFRFRRTTSKNLTRIRHVPGNAQVFEGRARGPRPSRGPRKIGSASERTLKTNKIITSARTIFSIGRRGTMQSLLASHQAPGGAFQHGA